MCFWWTRHPQKDQGKPPGVTIPAQVDQTLSTYQAYRTSWLTFGSLHPCPWSTLLWIPLALPLVTPWVSYTDPGKQLSWMVLPYSTDALRLHLCASGNCIASVVRWDLISSFMSSKLYSRNNVTAWDRSCFRFVRWRPFPIESHVKHPCLAAFKATSKHFSFMDAMLLGCEPTNLALSFR